MPRVIFANRSSGFVEDGLLKKLVARGSIVAYLGAHGWVIARWRGKREADNSPRHDEDKVDST